MQKPARSKGENTRQPHTYFVRVSAFSLKSNVNPLKTDDNLSKRYVHGLKDKAT
jgi:hypothetical protein